MSSVRSPIPDVSWVMTTTLTSNSVPVEWTGAAPWVGPRGPWVRRWDHHEGLLALALDSVSERSMSLAVVSGEDGAELARLPWRAEWGELHGVHWAGGGQVVALGHVPASGELTREQVVLWEWRTGRAVHSQLPPLPVDACPSVHAATQGRLVVHCDEPETPNLLVDLDVLGG